ncbi:hypothetical protein HYC85_004132 [Camellia sinensis]|uniref:Uncharacterized protein n=1 Tax=Camellia sinensis TaxID=4442 RepID=A0A7J7HWW7_CAMSI|nr:hypothetical protein HYC85_004132 [Camellia sinensis]
MGYGPTKLKSKPSPHKIVAHGNGFANPNDSIYDIVGWAGSCLVGQPKLPRFVF